LDPTTIPLDFLLPFVTAFVVILLFAWIFALILDKKHREDPMIPRSRIYPFNKENEPGIVFQEMYDIWAGRIFDIVSTVLGREKRTIDGEHYLSVLVWMLTLGGITGYFCTWYNDRSLWSLFIVCIIAGTFLYAHWRHDEPLAINP
jgi:hypothetical protein